ncbi:unnamed protein product [Bursaphelenchus okinawaensis]|uniref:Uncharacterized protein n=1 Tax=Bursaphelenchus okinawaensis TaxID=465554 RepID=A0A811LPM4_9BILA|nr:unnamed protein product [Bursaphelenchus okinawaensis]CAG9127226.1 unnamed protein product [Bursaphelenchus okinawaensis]
MAVPTRHKLSRTSYILLSVPELALQSFKLYTAFPRKLIKDESVTIAEAGLLTWLLNLSPNMSLTVKPPVDRNWIIDHKENTSIYM